MEKKKKCPARMKRGFSILGPLGKVVVAVVDDEKEQLNKWSRRTQLSVAKKIKVDNGKEKIKI